MSTFEQFLAGGDVPIGQAIPRTNTNTTQAIAPRFAGAGGRMYQEFPGNLYPIEPADNQLLAKAPYLSALYATGYVSTPARSAGNWSEGLFGQINGGAHYFVIMMSTGGFAGVEAWFGTSETTISGSITQSVWTSLSGGPRCVYNVGNSALLVSSYNGSSFNTISRWTSTINADPTNVFTATSNRSAYQLSGNATDSLFVAVGATNGSADNVVTSTNQTSWTSRTPSGFTSAGQVYLAFWCPAANSGAGAFVYIGQTRCWTTTDGYTQQSSALHGQTIDTNQTNMISQNRVASAAGFSIVALTNNVVRTTDGLTYTSVLSVPCLTVFADSGNYYAVARAGHIYKSTDNGFTWSCVTVLQSLQQSSLGRDFVWAMRKFTTGNYAVWYQQSDTASGGNLAKYALHAAPFSATHVGAYADAASANTQYQTIRIR